MYSVSALGLGICLPACLITARVFPAPTIQANTIPPSSFHFFNPFQKIPRPLPNSIPSQSSIALPTSEIAVKTLDTIAGLGICGHGYLGMTRVINEYSYGIVRTLLKGANALGSAFIAVFF